MSKNQLVKLHKQKPNIINFKPMVVQPLSKDYSNHLFFGGSIASLGVAFFGWEIKEQDARLDELKIICDKEVRFKESDDAKIVRLAEIEQARQTTLELQTRQHEHERSMAQKVLDDKKGIIPQIESTHEEVKVQVVRQGVNSTMSHFFSSNGPPTAQSTFEYPNLEVRVSWFLFVSIFTYREFFGCTSFFYLGVKSKRVLVPLVAYYTIKGTI
jgi:hypothetical protein